MVELLIIMGILWGPTYNNYSNNYTTVNIFSSGPPFTTINTSKPNYSYYISIRMEEGKDPNDKNNNSWGSSHANITAIVTNVTELSQIYADFRDFH